MSRIAKFLFLSFIFTTRLSIAADIGTLSGTITDVEGAAIRGARVIVHWDKSSTGIGDQVNVGIAQDLVLESDTYGSYSANLQPGFYDVFISATAFSPACRKVRVRSRGIVRYDVKLDADPLVIDELGDTFPLNP